MIRRRLRRYGCQAVEQSDRHLSIAEDARPFTEAEIGGYDDDDRIAGLPDRAFQSLLDIKALMRDATTLLKAASVVWHDNRARCDIII